MSTDARRMEGWGRLKGPWDVIVVGGGITGAGILREAARAKLKVLLLEQRDFGWGTTSRSSKLVHGGLRYLQQGHFRLTWQAVRERERLMALAPGLVDRLDFLLPTFAGDPIGRFQYGVGLAMYDGLAGVWQHEHYDRAEMQALIPDLADDKLTGGFRYHDASTDDVRLALRVLSEAVRDGASAINYAEAVGLVLEDGKAIGVKVRDAAGQLPDLEVRGKVVVNATGAWADRLRQQVEGPPRMRPLRGSHLVFPHQRLPLKDAIAIQHPLDHRAMFIFPWEGVSVVGTTDLDHGDPLSQEPAMTAAEVSYLMAALEVRFPKLRLGLDDVISTYSGVRPVVNTGKEHPSQETRDHVVWDERGLLTVTGGKLTTFRLIARDALKALGRVHPELASPPHRPPLDPVPELKDVAGLDPEHRRRIAGRHGAAAPALLQAAGPGELEAIERTSFLWAELRWAARNEWVEHLDDLLLRRVRVGLLVRRGGEGLLARVREICGPELGWSAERWAREEQSYVDLWAKHYSLPDIATVPDWRAEIRQRLPELALAPA